MIVKIIAFLIILSFSTPALAEGYWNDHLLTQIEKEPLSSQKGMNLISYHYVNNNLSDDENKYHLCPYHWRSYCCMVWRQH